MQRIRQPFHIGVALFVQMLVAPFSLFPGKPVLHQTGYRDVPPPERFRRLPDFFLCAVTLSGLDISIGPFGQKRRLPCNPPDAFYQIRHRFSGNHIIGGLFHRIEGNGNPVVPLLIYHQTVRVKQNRISGR